MYITCPFERLVKCLHVYSKFTKNDDTSVWLWGSFWLFLESPPQLHGNLFKTPLAVRPLVHLGISSTTPTYTHDENMKPHASLYYCSEIHMHITWVFLLGGGRWGALGNIIYCCPPHFCPHPTPNTAVASMVQDVYRGEARMPLQAEHLKCSIHHVLLRTVTSTQGSSERERESVYTLEQRTPAVLAYLLHDTACCSRNKLPQRAKDNERITLILGTLI